jgi:Protein of unknown function (DUF4019)
MKSLLTILLFILTLSATSLGEDKAAEQAATESANHWLAMVDGRDYPASWEAAAPVFKSAVSREQWARMLQSTRAPLGAVISRSVKSAVYTTTLPGAPDGRYVVIRYESSFEHKKSAIETVTPALSEDGRWKVSGYFIR